MRRAHGRLAANAQISKGHRAISNSKIFVGNLNFETTQTELKHVLSEVGRIEDVYLPTDRNTGRPRGFAFVEFADQTAAAEAIEKFDGFELAGRALRVNMAEERKPRAAGPPPRRDFGGGPPSGRNDSWGRGGDSGGRPAKPKGSRRGARGRKRSL